MSTGEHAPGGEPVGDGAGLTVGIVAAQWHPDLVEALLAGAARVGEQAKLTRVEVVRVPGALEIPVVAQQLAHSHDAVVALGVVVRGQTSHYDYVWQTVAQGLSRVSLDSGKPVGHGVLTTEDRSQAVDRVGLPGSAEDKGAEAMTAAINVALILRRVKTT